MHFRRIKTGQKGKEKGEKREFDPITRPSEGSRFNTDQIGRKGMKVLKGTKTVERGSRSQCPKSPGRMGAF